MTPPAGLLYAEALGEARRIAGELLDECNDPDVRGAAAKLADTIDGGGPRPIPG